MKHENRQWRHFLGAFLSRPLSLADFLTFDILIQLLGTYLRQVSIGDEMSNILWKRFYQLNMLAIPKITMVQLGSCFL